MSARRKQFIAAVGALALAASSGGCTKQQVLTSGNASLELSTNGETLTFRRGGQALLTFGTDGFQLGTVTSLTTGSPSFDPYWLPNSAAMQPQGLKWQALPGGGAMKLLSLTSSEMKIEFDYGGSTAAIAFTAGSANTIDALMTAQPAGNLQVGFMRMRPNAGVTEGFYGLGEWGDTVNHRGKFRPMQMELDPASESGDDEDHIPVPLLIGTNGWGLFVESKRPGSFDVATRNSTVVEVTYGTGEQSAAGLAFHLYSEPQPLDILKHYYESAGWPRLPAPWALGPLIWRDATTGESQVMSDISEIRSIPLATSGIWFDRPFASGVETFDFNPNEFPDPTTMLQALHDNGLRYGVWLAPYAAPADGKEDPAPAENAVAVADGYFPPVQGLEVNQWSPPIDFTNAAAYGWWQSNLQKYVNMGVEGFKLDYGEDIENGVYGTRDVWKFSDGSDERTMHYGYTILYHKVYSEMLPAAGGFLLCRTGRWGDQVHGPIIWPGDLDASMANYGDVLPGGLLAVGGLPAAIMKGIGLSASGFPFFASDTGGYRMAPSNDETYIRWSEASSLGTGMETGDSSSQTPWERCAECLTDYQKYSLLHLRLFPYEWTYANTMGTTGRPIERPFGLAFPELGQHPADEYVFGDSILVAPVMTPGATSRAVLLPPGNWVGWWDGVSHAGDSNQAVSVTVPADLDTLPLFIAEGGIVPMLRDTIETLAPVPSGSSIESYANDPGVLWVRVAPGPTATTFTLYDGASITQQKKGSSTSVSFRPGKSPTFASGALFEIIATPSPSSVTAGSALAQASRLADLQSASSGWFWQSATGGTLWVKVPGAATVTAE